MKSCACQYQAYAVGGSERDDLVFVVEQALTWAKNAPSSDSTTFHMPLLSLKGLELSVFYESKVEHADAGRTLASVCLGNGRRVGA